MKRYATSSLRCKIFFQNFTHQATSRFATNGSSKQLMDAVLGKSKAISILLRKPSIASSQCITNVSHYACAKNSLRQQYFFTSASSSKKAPNVESSTKINDTAHYRCAATMKQQPQAHGLALLLHFSLSIIQISSSRLFSHSLYTCIIHHPFHCTHEMQKT